MRIFFCSAESAMHVQQSNNSLYAGVIAKKKIIKKSLAIPVITYTWIKTCHALHNILITLPLILTAIEGVTMKPEPEKRNCTKKFLIQAMFFFSQKYLMRLNNS